MSVDDIDPDGWFGPHGTNRRTIKAERKRMNLIEHVLKLDKEATQGPWKNGKPTDAVVREAQPANPHGDDANVYYGGDLIAESISPKDKTLIVAYRTAAPKLARALKVALQKFADLESEFCMDGECGTPIADALDEIEKEAEARGFASAVAQIRQRAEALPRLSDTACYLRELADEIEKGKP